MTKLGEPNVADFLIVGGKARNERQGFVLDGIMGNAPPQLPFTHKIAPLLMIAIK